MRETNVYLTVTGCVIKETQKAILFRIHTIRDSIIEPKDEWFPKSQILKEFIVSPEEDQDTSWLLVSEWIMGQKGLLRSSPSPAASPSPRKHQNEPYYPTPSPNIKNSFDSYDDDVPF